MAIYLCPSTTKQCLWEGPGCDVVAHFEDYHGEHFLVSNQLNFDIHNDNRVNYMMNLFGQTYLVQTKYSKTNSDEKIELKLRYLGSPEKASKIRYYLEVVSGNFGFASNCNFDGYNTITSTTNGTIIVDVQGIKLTCGTNKLDRLTGYIHVENDSTEYAYRSIRRRQFDHKNLETKIRSSVKRKLSNRSNPRRHSMEKMEFPDAIKNSNQDESNIENAYYEDIKLDQFLHDIMGDIFRRAMEEIDKRDLILRQFSIDNCPVSDIKYLYDNQEKQVIMDVVEFKTRDDIFKIRYDTMVTQPKFNEADKIIGVDEQILREGFVTKFLVPNVEMPCTEFIEDDIRHSQKLDVIKDDKIDAELIYLKKLEAIRCKNCSMFMIPPIFMCLNGHSVCVMCKTLTCEICDQEVTDVRNYDLEDISRSVMHPCRFRARGCREALSCYEIRYHEIYCDYCIYECPLCCKTDNFVKIRGHIKLVHPSLKIVETNDHPFVRGSAFLIANKLGMFYCTSQVRNSSIEWKVKYCGIEMISFNCEVRIKGKKNEKCYHLYRNGNLMESYICLNELKSARVKEKHAMLHMAAW